MDELDRERWPPELIPIMEASLEKGEGGDHYLMGIHFALTIADKSPELASFLRVTMERNQPGLNELSDKLYELYLNIVVSLRKRDDPDP